MVAQRYYFFSDNPPREGLKSKNISDVAEFSYFCGLNRIKMDETTHIPHPAWSYPAVIYELNVRQLTPEGLSPPPKNISPACASWASTPCG